MKLFPSDLTIEEVKRCLCDGPLHECKLVPQHYGKATFTNDDHDTTFSELVIFHLAGRRLAVIEGEPGQRTVRITS
jgi:hypothetical protein